MRIVEPIVFCSMVVAVVFGLAWSLQPVRHDDGSGNRCDLCGKPARLFTSSGLEDEYLCTAHTRLREAEISETWPIGINPRSQHRQVEGIDVYGDHLTDSDIAAIRIVVADLPNHVNKRILNIMQITRDKATVVTGELRGPLDGGGDMIYMKRRGEKWYAIRADGWVS